MKVSQLFKTQQKIMLEKLDLRKIIVLDDIEFGRFYLACKPSFQSYFNNYFFNDRKFTFEDVYNDSTLDLFIALQKGKDFDNIISLRNFLSTIMRNKLNDQLKNQNSINEVNINDAIIDYPLTEDDLVFLKLRSVVSEFVNQLEESLCKKYFENYLEKNGIKLTEFLKNIMNNSMPYRTLEKEAEKCRKKGRITLKNLLITNEIELFKILKNYK